MRDITKMDDRMPGELILIAQGYESLFTSESQLFYAFQFIDVALAEYDDPFLYLNKERLLLKLNRKQEAIDAFTKGKQFAEQKKYTEKEIQFFEQMLGKAK